MASADHILASAVAALVAVAESYGISLSQLGAGPLSQLVDPERPVSETIVLALWRALAEQMPGRSVGLELVSKVPFSFYGPLGHGMRFASDLRQSLELLVAFRKVLAARIELSLHELPEGLQVRMAHPLDAHDGGYGAEFGHAITARFVAEELGHRDAVHSVAFAHPQIGPDAIYAQTFGAPVSFEQPFHAIIYKREALSRPNPKADPAQYLFIKQHITRIHAAQLADGGRPFVARVRAAVTRTALRRDYLASSVAHELGVSLRTLQRRAREHGIDLRGTLDEVREATARALLRDPSLSIDQVAERVGYATESAFRRAFKRWTGNTPTEARQAAEPAG